VVINRSTIVVLFAVMINMTGVGLFWPILPSLVEELSGGTVSQTALAYGSISVVFAVMQFLFAPVMGALSDRFGRRPVLLLALTGMGLDSIIMALAPSLFWLFVARAAGGVFGATFSVANAYMADVTEGKDRAGAFGLIGAAFGLGFILGPLMGGVLGAIDVRLPIFVAAGLSFCNVLVGYFFLKESLPPENRSKKPLFQANILSSLRWIAQKRVVVPLAIALFIANTMERGLESIWVLFTDVQYGWGTKEAGLSLAVVGVSFVIVQGFLVKPIVARFGEIATIAGGFSLSALMYALLAFNEIGLVGYLGIVPHVLGWGVAGPALQALASRQVDETEQGYMQGALTSIAGLSSIIGPAMATGSFAYFTSAAAPVYFPGVFFLLGSFFLLAAAYCGTLAGRQQT